MLAYLDGAAVRIGRPRVNAHNVPGDVAFRTANSMDPG